MFGSGTPHTENCSQYSGSTDHTCVIVEPPIQRTASKGLLYDDVGLGVRTSLRNCTTRFKPLAERVVPFLSDSGILYPFFLYLTKNVVNSRDFNSGH